MAIGGAADVEPVGRLFFTPEYRSQLEKARWTHSSVHATPQHLDGVLIGSQGGATLWIDQHIWRDQRGAVTPSNPERATIRDRGGEPKSLRVGESLDAVTADKSDLLSGGRIVVHKR
jgi:hypothetical protein